MAKDQPNWDGLLKWSLSHSDGSHPSRHLRGVGIQVGKRIFKGPKHALEVNMVKISFGLEVFLWDLIRNVFYRTPHRPFPSSRNEKKDKGKIEHGCFFFSNQPLSWCNIEEDRRWFMEAMQANTVDVIKRMKEITQVMQTPEQVLEAQGVTAADIEDMLDELQEHVESIDMANDLHSIGGLVPLINYLRNQHANIRAKAADVVTTIVQNNPRSQQLVMEANGFEPLLTNFTSDPDMNVRTQALSAISSLIRHNKLGIAAFRLANGYAALRDALSSDSVRFQRKALNLLHYLLHENKSDSTIVTELGFPRIVMHLASSDDSTIREAALQGLLELARGKTNDTNTSFTEEDEKMKQLLQDRINDISKMSSEDLGAAKEERQLVDSLWNACYNEPSSLREKGLLVLPGEDAPPPDVASKHFEPPLRAWAAKREPDTPSEPAKQQAPLLIGPGPGPGPRSETGGVQSSSNTEAQEDEQQRSASS